VDLSRLKACVRRDDDVVRQPGPPEVGDVGVDRVGRMDGDERDRSAELRDGRFRFHQRRLGIEWFGRSFDR
jgi:hypothetical protein